MHINAPSLRSTPANQGASDMNASTKKLMLTTALFATLAAHPGAAVAESGLVKSLCRAPEAVLFTCGIRTRTVSVCGQEQGGAVYRFGRPGRRVELEVPDLHRAQTGWWGSGETQVYADTPTHRYVIYDRMVRTGYDDEGHYLSKMTEGLMVRSKGRTLSNQDCTQPIGLMPPAFDQRLLETLVPEGKYVDH